MQAPNEYQLLDAAQEWSIIYNQRNQTPPRTGTGIHDAWVQMLLQGKRMGPVVTQEESAKDWNGNDIIVQHCLYARCEWSGNVAKWFDSRGQIA